MRYTLSELAAILDSSLHGKDQVIRDVVTDSRRILRPDQSVFIAIQGPRFNGHDFIQVAYDKGLRSFIVQDESKIPGDASYIKVPDALNALQEWAAHHRRKFDYPVIAITGSYGKTTVKERLAGLLGHRYSIIRSPRSYNSQVGVPLSVLGMEKEHDLAIFEAGISEMGEMESLAKIIQPDIGVFTGLRDAHKENFKDHAEHLAEKCRLFADVKMLIYACSADDAYLNSFIKSHGIQGFSWGEQAHADLHILEKKEKNGFYELDYCAGGGSFSLRISKQKGGHFENEMHCLSVLYATGEVQAGIKEIFENSIPQTLLPELTRSRSGSALLSQTGLLDAAQLSIALEQLQMNAQEKQKVIILVETEAPLANVQRIESLARVLEKGKGEVPTIICIGNGMQGLADKLHKRALFFHNSSDFHAFLTKNGLKGDFLISGSWSPSFMQIRSMLQAQGHHTRVIIDMEAMVHNLNVFRELVGPDVKVMCMVKASAYGTGDTELARLLEFHRVDYLGVAYPDEGIQLRRQGIRTPIMVMNSALNELDGILSNDLELTVYSIDMLKDLIQKWEGLSYKDIRIHMEFDTGMHRLGIATDEIDEVLNLLEKNPWIKVQSVFSHLIASEDPKKETWTQGQLKEFEKVRSAFELQSNSSPMYHILNTAGISRYPSYRMDMVRLGIGLYGHDTDQGIAARLQPILSWETEIRQVKTVKKGETISYGGNFALDQDTQIAILPIGYADGIHRSLGHGKGKVFIQGNPYSFIGSICMDMCMVDLKNLTFSPGEPVEIIGVHQSLEELADQLVTIAYEVLTSIPGRVKRTYLNG